MTISLCLACGELKFGAYCPCPKCGAEPEEQDKPLSVRLSDHYLADETLREIGQIVRFLRQASDDPRACLDALARFLVREHPEIYDDALTPEAEARAEALLARIDLPRIVPRPSVKVLLARRIIRQRG